LDRFTVFVFIGSRNEVPVPDVLYTKLVLLPTPNFPVAQPRIFSYFSIFALRSFRVTVSCLNAEYLLHFSLTSRDNSVGIAMVWTAWVRFSAGQANFVYSAASSLALRPNQSAVQWVQGAIFRGGLKWPWREADHRPPSSVEVKNVELYIHSPPHMFMAWDLIKHRDNFTFVTHLRNIVDVARHFTGILNLRLSMP
jgi:hypothetical protein